MKKLAYVRIQFPGQPIEDSLLQGLAGFEVLSVGWDATGGEYSPEEGCFVPLKMRKLLPDAVADLFVRKPYSAVSFAVLEGLEEALEEAEILYTTELYSFLSRQCAEIAEKTGKKLVISCFETLRNSPPAPPSPLPLQHPLRHGEGRSLRSLYSPSRNVPWATGRRRRTDPHRVSGS
jgi:hypothetical protein